MRTWFIAILVFVLPIVVGCAGASVPVPPTRAAQAATARSSEPSPSAAPSSSVLAPDPGEPYEIVGYLFRDRDGALAVDSIVPTNGVPSVWIGGPRAAELAALVADTTEFATISGYDAIADRRYEDTTLVSAVGDLKDANRRTHLSPIVIGARGVIRGGKLEIAEVTGVVTSRSWNDSKPAYFAALKEARRAFDANDVPKARRALLDAREVVAAPLGALAPNFEVYRLIDGLATRFDKACDRVTREHDPTSFADAVIPLRRARQMEGRMAPFPEETEAVFAAFVFAKRMIFRVLKAELGAPRDVPRARALMQMAGVDPKRDVAMLQWIYAHVPEAARLH